MPLLLVGLTPPPPPSPPPLVALLLVSLEELKSANKLLPPPLCSLDDSFLAPSEGFFLMENFRAMEGVEGGEDKGSFSPPELSRLRDFLASFLGILSAIVLVFSFCCDTMRWYLKDLVGDG